jgi:folate-binding protein YgfZ
VSERHVANLDGHTVVRVRGDEPLKFLDATTTQAVADLRPGLGALACLLDEKGHVLSEFRVVPLENGDVLLDGTAAAREALTGWLARVAPLSGCEVTDESSAWSCFSVRGEAPRGEYVVHESADEIVIGVEWGLPGIDIFARSMPPETPGAREAIEAARIDAVRPLYGVDVTSEHIVNETPLLARALSRTKGCYPGQETVAKIANLGRPRRAVAGLTGDAPVRAGAVVRAGDAEVGRITSAFGVAAIATLRAEALARGDLEADGVAVRAR